MLKNTFVSLCLNAGIIVGKQIGNNNIMELLKRLYPVSSGIPLVRIGDTNDGTYLIPDDLQGIFACFSPGVSNRASFEEFFVQRGVRCYLADASVDKAPIQSDLVEFTKKFVGAVNDDYTLRMDDWVATRCPGSEDLLLQMDIESAEWHVLLDTSPSTIDRFRIICLELHDMERIFDKFAFPIIKSVFDKLLRNFVIVHSHPNNHGWYVKRGSLVVPRSLEVTLLRKDRVKSMSFAKTFPHPLDIKNAIHLPDIPLPKHWFSSEDA